MTDIRSLMIKILSENNMEKYTKENILNKLIALTEEMLSVNEYMNLTAIKEPEEIILKHYVDSLTVIPFIPQNAKLIDIGSGAGFPAFPIAIARPDVNVTSLDSTRKKLNYIENTAVKLNLYNIDICIGRAEEISKLPHMRESFDVAVARAVAPLQILCELSIPFIKVGGRFIAMKGVTAGDEVNSSCKATTILGSGTCKNHFITLKHNKDVHCRHIIISDKIKQTPDNYPRNYSQITKNPL